MSHMFQRWRIPIDKCYAWKEKIVSWKVDTSGDPIFEPVMEQQIRRGDGCVVIFAVDDLDSFEVAIKKIKLVKHNPSIVMVASKCDKQERKVDINTLLNHKHVLSMYIISKRQVNSKCRWIKLFSI